MTLQPEMTAIIVYVICNLENIPLHSCNSGLFCTSHLLDAPALRIFILHARIFCFFLTIEKICSLSLYVYVICDD
uniref:Uncharacterized protein n=1 Tax=Arundo donax TaxID=35708 RepID=A0A0A9E298_ARUDO